MDEKWGPLWRLAFCRRQESDDVTRHKLRQHISSAAASIVRQDACASMDWFLTSSLLPPRSYCFPFTSGAFYDLIFFFQAVPCLFYVTAVLLLVTKTPPAFLFSTCLSPFATPWCFFWSLAAFCCATNKFHFCSQLVSTYLMIISLFAVCSFPSSFLVTGRARRRFAWHSRMCCISCCRLLVASGFGSPLFYPGVWSWSIRLFSFFLSSRSQCAICLQMRHALVRNLMHKPPSFLSSVFVFTSRIVHICTWTSWHALRENHSNETTTNKQFVKIPVSKLI